MAKIVSQLDDDGYFVAAVVADESPIEPGVYLLPAGAIDKAPPAVVEPGKRYRVWGAGWRGEDLPPVAEVPQVPELAQQQVRLSEIAAELWRLDMESVRPARELAIALAQGLPAPAFAQGKLASLENQAALLRAELAALVA